MNVLYAKDDSASAKTASLLP